MNIHTFILGFIGLVLTFYILFIGKAIIIPLVIAIIIWYIIIALTGAYKKIRIGSWHIPHWLALIMSLLSFLFLAWLFVGFVNSNISEVIEAAPKYQAKFQSFINDLNNRFNLEEKITFSQISEWINVGTLATTAAGIITTIAGFMSMIILYVLFLLLEYHTFDWKIKALFPEKKRRESTENLIDKIATDINTYIKIKTFVSALTAIVCYIILLAMGIQFAGFWAVLIFVLNFIPNVGSLVAVALPVLFSIIQFDLSHALLLAILLVATQISIGNFLEPRLMGKSLNLSPLVIIISLVIWGSIWGIVGMFLCVPIMVIINIILAKFDSTRPIAILLSSKGILNL
ncbi:MAG: AI-2E family transporter [Patescibacteria group bacterium]|nr:AI-2E family transporter [Patescibacteria group bacterium]